MILLLTLNMGYTQNLLSLPEANKPIDLDSSQGLVSSTWDLKNISDTPYYDNFYDNAKPTLILQLNKTEKGINLKPIETYGKNVLVEFWKNEKVTHSYYETKNKLKGPILDDNSTTEEICPKLVYSKTLISEEKQIWPILVLMAVCCIKIEYRYESGKPPKQMIKVSWNCNCLTYGNQRLRFKVDEKIIDADFITYTIDNVAASNNMKMIITK